MDIELSRLLNRLSDGRPIKVNYEQLKTHMNYEDIFYDEYLKPFLDKHNLSHRFNGEFIVLERGKNKGAK